MLVSLIIIWSFIGIIVASLTLITILDEAGGYPDIEDISLGAVLSIALGAVWPITIWIGLILWYHNSTTPEWVNALSNFFSYVKKIKGILCSKK